MRPALPIPPFSAPALALGALLFAGCPSDPDPDDSGPGDTGDPGCSVTDPPDLACTQAAFDRDYFYLAREAIRAADTRVHVIEYLLYDSGLAGLMLQELVDASARGVEVKVLADEAGDPDTTDNLSWLVSASGNAIQAKLDSEDTVTHDKLIITDDVTLVGSHNMSGSSLADNHESSAYLVDAEVTAFYEGFFQGLWADSDVDPGLQKPAGTEIVPIKNREIGGYLLGCLDGAQESVRLVMYAISYRPGEPGDVTDLVNHLVAAHDRGLDVAVVLDQSEWITDNHINDEVIALLLDHGVPLRLADRDVTTHAKALRCDETVILGDCNWSYSSLELYNGTSVQITMPLVIRQYGAWFDDIWDAGEAP
ncbi:MAG: phospholipase D-like domain-containing protein [Pseudomonadota bacterium]